MERKSTAGSLPILITDQGILSRVLWVTGFTALTAVGAQIEISHYPVPYTLQTLFVLLAGAVLGSRAGAMSQVVYLVLGIIGLPVFSGWGFGVMRIVGPTGGYLLGFPVAAFIVGSLLREHRSYLWIVVAMFAGLFVVFTLGTIHLNLVYYHDWAAAIGNGFLIFSWWDVVKLFAAAAIYRQVARFRVE